MHRHRLVEGEGRRVARPGENTEHEGPKERPDPRHGVYVREVVRNCAKIS